MTRIGSQRHKKKDKFGREFYQFLLTIDLILTLDKRVRL